MTYSAFMDVCKALGDKNLPEADRWKSIIACRFDGETYIDFQKLYKERKCYFIGSNDGPSGFFVIVQPAAEYRAKDGSTGNWVVKFYNLEYLWSVHFNTEGHTIDNGSLSMKQIMNDSSADDTSFMEGFGKTVESSYAALPELAYEFETVDDINIPVIEVNDPAETVAATFTTGFYTTKASAESATTNTGATTITAAGTYYFKAFCSTGNNSQVATVIIKN